MRRIFKSNKMCENFTASVSRVLQEINTLRGERVVDSTKRLQPPLVNTRPFTVVVEGNIGSGKTTFLEHFKKFNEVETLTEPVDKWRNANGHNLLQMAYEDPVRFDVIIWCGIYFTEYCQVEPHFPDLCAADHAPEPYSGKNFSW